MCKTWCPIRIRIRIKMENPIRIRNQKDAEKF